MSLATLSESLQEMNFNREKKDSFNQETEQVLLKMQSSFKDSFSQVREKYEKQSCHGINQPQI